MSTIIIPPYMNLQSAGEYADSAPNAPTIVSAEQASGIVVVGFLAAPISGVTPTSSFNLYRSISGADSYSLVATNLISLTSVENLIFDRDASAAVRYDYYVCAVDDNGNISQPSNVVSFTPFNPALFSLISSSRNVSNAAFGPYPVLGSDLYLNSTTRDIVIGPNGDYLAVNGLELLAQDLRIRFLTELGELSLHQDFGFDRSAFIGSGISSRALQVTRLYQRFSAMLYAEPRVSNVLDVQIAQTASDGWVITYIIVAIGSEDPAELNMVVPFLGGGTRNPATALPNSAVLVLPSSE